MRQDNATFAAKNLAAVKRPRYVIEQSFTADNSILRYFTSHSDAALPGGASALLGVVVGISGTSQTLNPDTANASIGAISYRLLDKDSQVTTSLGAQLALGRSTRRMRTRVYVGYEGMAWADYVLVQTQIVTRISYHEGVYTFKCADVQREMRKDIFELATTQLAATLKVGATEVEVVSTAGFGMVQHGTSYSDAPSQLVGYLKIEDEVIRFTAFTATKFTGCTRGALNTREVEHEMDPNAAIDRRTPVEEYVYLEMPALKLIYALLTGIIYAQGGATLPAKWHLGIPAPSFVRTNDFINQRDLWDTADDTKGLVVRFEGLEKTDAKKFIEQELLLLAGVFMPVYADGALGLKRMANILSGSAYVHMLDATNLKKVGDLDHDFDSLRNQIQIEWNWEPSLQRYTRKSLLIDSDSITVHGKGDPLKLKFRGLHGSRHASTTLARQFDAIRDRFTGPPLKINVDALPSLNMLEVGDVIRLRPAGVRDLTDDGGQPLDRSFEIQGTQIDWISGDVSFKLFGSSQAPGAIPPTADSTIITNAWYTSQGTALSSVLTITGSNPGHVSANGTLNGTADMNAAASVFYYEGDLVIDPGVTVTINGNVQLRIKGFLTVNGKIDGKGRGLTGAAAGDGNPGTAGLIGTTEAGGGQERPDVPWVSGRTDSTRANPTVGAYPAVPAFQIVWDGSSLTGLPTDQRGTSGGSGKRAYINTVGVANGGAGGAGGAGLRIVCRGFGQGVAGVIDLSGNDGSVGGTLGALLVLLLVLYAGSGAGGAPGALVIALDGALATATGLTPTSFKASYGKTPVSARVLPQPSMSGTEVSRFIGTPPANLYSYFVGTSDGTIGNGGSAAFAIPDMSGGGGAARVQPVPANVVAQPDPVQNLDSPEAFELIGRAVATVTGGVQIQLEGRWLPTIDPLVAGYDLQYKKSSDVAWPTSLVSVTPRTTRFAVIAQNLQSGIKYDARIRSAGSLRNVGDWVTIRDFMVAPTSVSGLELVNIPAGAIPGTPIFIGNDALFVWRADSLQNSEEIGSETNGAGGGGLDDSARDYLVRIYNVDGSGSPTTLRREEILIGITQPSYLYTLAKNKEDGNGVPVRTFMMKVWRRGTNNEISPVPAQQLVTNAQAGQPASSTLRAEFNSIIFEWTPPANELDVEGIVINVSTTNGFAPSGTTPGSGNCRYAGPDRLVIIDGLAPNTTYYVKAACFDVYGRDVLNYTTQLQITTERIVTGDLTPGLITLNEHAAGLRPIEIVGALPAAGQNGRVVFLTSDSKLYRDNGVSWTVAVPAADLTGTLAEGHLAVNVAYIRNAAMIANAIITNAHVNDLSANKITAGFLDAARFSTAVAYITVAAQIASAVIGNAHITDLNATKINAGDINTSRLTANVLAALQAVISNLAAINADIGAITAGTITLNTSGHIKAGQTAYNTGVGFWLGNDSSVYKFSIGNSAGEYLTWDGSNLTINARISGQNIVLTGTSPITIVANTSDGSDDKVIGIAGGGALGTSRGGQIQLLGNEVSATGNGGSVLILAGNNSSGANYPGSIQLSVPGGPGVDATVIITRDANMLMGDGTGTVGRTQNILYIPTWGGTPTSTPTAHSGRVPFGYDTSANKLWVYNGAWRSVALA